MAATNAPTVFVQFRARGDLIEELDTIASEMLVDRSTLIRAILWEFVSRTDAPAQAGAALVEQAKERKG